MVLGKLPEIEDKRSASRMNRDQMSDGSTTAMTNSCKARDEVVTVNKKEQEEEPYWDWKLKQQKIYLSPPVHLATPRSARTKKVLPPISNQTS